MYEAWAWRISYHDIQTLAVNVSMPATHITYVNYRIRYHVNQLLIPNLTFIAKQLVAYQAVYYAAMSSVKLSYL
jgi:hypothetical protein